MGNRLFALVFCYLIYAITKTDCNHEEAKRIRFHNDINVKTKFKRSTIWNCTVNEKVYNEGETWSSNHLRFQCAKFGSRHVLGCVTGNGKNININETYIDDNVAHQCIKKGPTTRYREIVCGIVGQPDCDKLNFNDTIVLNQPFRIINEKGNLPAGWKRVHSDVIPTETDEVHNKIRNKDTGLGSATPIDLLVSNRTEQNKRIVGIGDGSVSLDSRTPIASHGTSGLKQGTVGGQRSDVNWSGKTITIGGKRVAVGAGNFSFGVSHTGAFFSKSDKK